MLLSRVSPLARTATRATRTSTTSTRALAIAATCKKAPDTSAMDFPAPSHVSVTGQAADIASQLSAFYSNPDSVVTLSEGARADLRAEIVKKVQAIPDSESSDVDVASIEVPEKIRLGDSPLFGTIGSK